MSRPDRDREREREREREVASPALSAVSAGGGERAVWANPRNEMESKRLDVIRMVMNNTDDGCTMEKNIGETNRAHITFHMWLLACA